jgi:hypothetical protein
MSTPRLSCKHPWVKGDKDICILWWLKRFVDKRWYGLEINEGIRNLPVKTIDLWRRWLTHNVNKWLHFTSTNWFLTQHGNSFLLLAFLHAWSAVEWFMALHKFTVLGVWELPSHHRKQCILQGSVCTTSTRRKVHSILSSTKMTVHLRWKSNQYESVPLPYWW